MSGKRVARWFTAALALFVAPAAMASTLWGVDEDDGQLVQLDSQTFSFTDYGLLQFDDGGTLKTVDAEIEAFAIDSGGIAYMATNAGIGGYTEPVLLRLDLNNASTVTPNVVQIMGTINVAPAPGHNTVTGLAFDGGGSLLAVFRNESTSNSDELLVLDKNTGSVLQNRGKIENAILALASVSTEDMAFDMFGNLFVTDNFNDRLYRIDPLTATILELVNANERAGLGPNPLKIEALVFDPMTGVLLGVDDNADNLVSISTTGGNSVLLTNLGALDITDIEGLAAMPMVIPEPASVALTMLGVFLVAGRRPRRRSTATEQV